MLYRVLIIILLLGLPLPVFGQGKVRDYQLVENGNELQLKIEATSIPTYKVFQLPNPERLVVDFKKMNRGQALPVGKTLDMPLVKRIRSGIRDGLDLRVVLDMKNKFQVTGSKVISPSGQQKNYHLVINLSVKGVVAKQKPFAKTPKPQKPDFVPVPIFKPAAVEKKKEEKKQKPLVIVDPGHGGLDPGAQGYAGTYEKHVTLSYARALVDTIRKSGKYRVMLTRNSDDYVGLVERVHMAKTNEGDLFISLHADAHSDKDLQGLSIYTLSETASDKEAAALAAKENKLGMLYDVNLGKEDAEIADVLIDIIQRENANASSILAETLISELGREVKLLKYPHRFAGFRVLTAPDIPSLLIELGYLSNPEEEGLLNSPPYKKKVVNAIVRSIDTYFKDRMSI